MRLALAADLCGLEQDFRLSRIPGRQMRRQPQLISVQPTVRQGRHGPWQLLGGAE